MEPQSLWHRMISLEFERPVSRIGIIKKGELVKEMNTTDVSTNELENIYIDYIQN